MFTCDRYECYGPYRSVIEKVSGGDSCQVTGWVSGHAFLSKDIARGKKFTNISPGPEVMVDSDAS